eukprot:105064-Chlamydomonas_euryale.AAC.1
MQPRKYRCAVAPAAVVSSRMRSSGRRASTGALRLWSRAVRAALVSSRTRGSGLEPYARLWSRAVCAAL